MVSQGDKIKAKKEGEEDTVYLVEIIEEKIDDEEYYADYRTEILDIVEGDSLLIAGDRTGVFEEEIIEVENDE